LNYRYNQGSVLINGIVIFTMSRIFINYRRQDSEGYVGRLYDRLCDHFDAKDIFMDVTTIRPGEDFVQTLEDAVAGCDVVLTIIGPQWLAASNEQGERRLHDPRDFVRIEIASAIKHNKGIIPVLVGGAKMPPTSELPDEIAPLTRRNALELSHQRFAYDVEQLAQAIKLAIVPAKPAAKARANSETLRRKIKALKALKDEIYAAQDAPLYAYRKANNYSPVLGDGNPDANILFIGQAPGEYEAIQGRAFIGASGDVLDEMLDSIGMKRDDIYITNLVLDRPPDNRDPLPTEIDYYASYLDRMIRIIQPGVIVTLGRFAMFQILKRYDLPERKFKISQLHGKLLTTTVDDKTLFILPLYHPAVVLYSTNERATLRADFQQLKPFV
jgi:uracil-DNA glycosylase